jgi:hypothetical protein
VRIAGDSLVRIADRSHLPTWLRAGTRRLLAVCLVVWLIEMLPIRLTPARARDLVIVGAILVGLVVAGFALRVHQTLARLDIPFLSSGVARAEAILLTLRRVGILLIGLAFFLFWTLVYIFVWWWNPDKAFMPPLHRPLFADFFYVAVSTAFISPPGDIAAHTRGARAATMTEMITGAALLSAYVGAFVDWQSQTAPADETP